MYFATLLVATAVTLLGFLPQAASVVVPPPAPQDKNFTVAVHHEYLVDSSRKDPYNPSEDRKLEFSLFMPVWNDMPWRMTNKWCYDKFTPSETAALANLQFFGDRKADIFEQLEYYRCCSSEFPTDAKNMPLVVFEPTVDVSRLLYMQLARQVAANGAVVVLIDHPYDASIVEFNGTSDKILNNGTVALDPFQVNRFDDIMGKAVDTRMADINFVISQIGSIDALKGYFPDLNFKSGLNTDTFYIMGHGLGGTVATSFSAIDGRVSWAVNLAGTTPVIQNDIQDYIVLFGHEGYSSDNDTNWSTSWKHFTGRATEWHYSKAEHMDFTDLPLIVDLIKPKQKAKGVGGLGIKAFTCTACFLEAYVRDTIMNEHGAQISHCLDICKPEMEPKH